MSSIDQINLVGGNSLSVGAIMKNTIHAPTDPQQGAFMVLLQVTQMVCPNEVLSRELTATATASQAFARSAAFTSWFLTQGLERKSTECPQNV